MGVLLTFIVLSVLTTSAYIYFVEYLGNGILYYTMPLMFIASFIVLFIVFILILWVLLLFNKKDGVNKFFYFFSGQVAEAVRIFFRIKIIREDYDKIPKDTRFMFVSNHQSIFDPIALVGELKKQRLTYIMKDGVMKIPFAGRWLKASGFFPLDRNNDRNALKTILSASKQLQLGYPVAAFPEGTRSKTTNINDFKSGVFKIAERAKAPIVVATIDNFFSVKERFPWRRTKVVVRICKVLEYLEYENLTTNQISEIIRNTMLENQKDLREKYSFIEYRPVGEKGVI